MIISIARNLDSPSRVLHATHRRPTTQVTFSKGPPTRWSAARKSPELRIYRSLPSRHQDYRESLVDVAASCKPEEPRGEDCIENIEDKAKGANETTAGTTWSNERAKREEKSIGKSEEEVPDPLTIGKRTERTVKEQEDHPAPEQSTPRVSLIKPPRILAKLTSPESRASPTKHGERKSNIPIFKRSSKEFEDIGSPQESPKRSLIPQRYNYFASAIAFADHHLRGSSSFRQQRVFLHSKSGILSITI